MLGLQLLVFVGLSFAWNHATEAGLRTALRSNDYALIAFVLPSQDKSQKLEAEWISIQETERNNNVISFDCNAKPRPCAELDVVSFPTIRLYRDQGNTLSRYRGPRRASAIVLFLRRSLRPPLSKVDSKNITSFVSVDDVIFVAYLRPDDKNLRDRFELLADQYHDRFSFALSLDKHNHPGISCYNNPDDVQRSTAELSTIESLEIFVKLCTTPLIPELTKKNEMDYASAGKSLVHYFVAKTADRNDFVKEMLPLAKKYEDYLQFTTTDTNEYPEMLEVFGHTPGSEKMLSVQNPDNGDIFPYRVKGKLSLKSVEAFLLDIIDGKVMPWSRSESGQDFTHEEL